MGYTGKTVKDRTGSSDRDGSREGEDKTQLKTRGDPTRRSREPGSQWTCGPTGETDLEEDCTVLGIYVVKFGSFWNRKLVIKSQ